MNFIIVRKLVLSSNIMGCQQDEITFLQNEMNAEGLPEVNGFRPYNRFNLKSQSSILFALILDLQIMIKIPKNFSHAPHKPLSDLIYFLKSLRQLYYS